MSTISTYFLGDCKGLDDYLKDRRGPFWGLVKYLNALFRGVGQVVFANNPWSGFIILASLYWASLLVGFATTVAATTAILTAIVFKQEESKINAGLTTYCAVLVGSITSSLWEPTYGQPVTPILWGFIVLAASLSVLVNAALVNILASFKPPLPSFTLAFNIVTILLFTALQPRDTPIARSSPGVSSQKFDLDRGTLTSIFSIPSPGIEHERKVGEVKNPVDVLMVIEGIMLSMGQVYGVQHLKGSVAMYISTILYSPTVCVMSVVGATVGSCFGLVFAGPTYQTVYDGIWGFNAILAAIAVGAFFFVPTSLSFATALADVALVVLIQVALIISFTPLHLPFLTFPFVISSIFFLELTATGDILTRVTKFSYPEKHLREFIALKHLRPPPHVASNTEITHRRTTSDWPSAPMLPIYYQPVKSHSPAEDFNRSSLYPNGYHKNLKSDNHHHLLHNPEFHPHNVTHDMVGQPGHHVDNQFDSGRTLRYPQLFPNPYHQTSSNEPIGHKHYSAGTFIGQQSQDHHLMGQQSQGHHLMGQQSQDLHLMGQKSHDRHLMGQQSHDRHVIGQQSHDLHLIGQKPIIKRR